jgi:hypothetical protein
MKIIKMSDEKKRQIIRELENTINEMEQDHQWAHQPSREWEVGRQEEVDNTYHKLVDALNSVRYDRTLLRAEASQTTRDAYPIVSDDEWAEALLNLN